nr:MAG TPA: hypothetical protein [Caudoviricetes sp.]
MTNCRLTPNCCTARSAPCATGRASAGRATSTSQSFSGGRQNP